VNTSANIIKQIQNNSNNKLYLYCQPISYAPPQDIPEITKISQKYWSSKLIIQIDNSIIKLSEWFSMPIINIQKVLQNNPMGPLYLSLNDFHYKELNVLFSNVNPVFKFTNSIDKETTKWIKNTN